MAAATVCRWAERPLSKPHRRRRKKPRTATVQRASGREGTGRALLMGTMMKMGSRALMVRSTSPKRVISGCRRFTSSESVWLVQAVGPLLLARLRRGGGDRAVRFSGRRGGRSEGEGPGGGGSIGGGMLGRLRAHARRGQAPRGEGGRLARSHQRATRRGRTERWAPPGLGMPPLCAPE